MNVPRPEFDVRRRVWLLLFFLVLPLAVLQVWPLRLPANDPRLGPVLPLRQTGHPVLLLVEPSILGSPDAPSDLQWRDVLQRVFGGCDVQPIGNLRADAARQLQPRRLVVIAAGTLDAQSVDLLETLRPFVETGLDVILEAPQGAIAQALGVEASGLETRTRLPWPLGPQATALGSRFRLAPGHGLGVPYRVVSARPAPTARARSRPTLSPAGRPLVWTLPEGEGAWILHMLDLGSLVRLLWNGRITSEASSTVDRAAAPRLRTTDHAWADAWIQALLDADCAPTPWPQVWPTSANAQGWLVVSQNAPASVRDAPAPTCFARQGSAEGLLGVWTRSSQSAELLPRRFFGLGPLRWAWRPAGVSRQAASVDPRPLLHRNFQWQWPADTDRAWQTLAGAGFRADSSWGPAPGPGGWTSGTSLPFHPLAANGLSHVVVEVPVHWRGRAQDLDLARIARWLRDNRVSSHGAVHVAIEGSLPVALLDSLRELAARHGHALASVGDVLDIRDRRERISWQWEFHGRTLRIEVGPTSQPGPALAFAVPLQWNGRRLVAWDASWGRPHARRATTFGKEVLVIEHPDQGGAVTFTYGGG